MSAAACDYYLAEVHGLAYALNQLTIPNVFEESWGIHNVQLVQKLREVPLHLKHKLAVYFSGALIGHVFQLRSFHVNNHFDLINSLFIDEFLAIGKFVSPSVL